MNCYVYVIVRQCILYCISLKCCIIIMYMHMNLFIMCVYSIYCIHMHTKLTNNLLHRLNIIHIGAVLVLTI